MIQANVLYQLQQQKSEEKGKQERKTTTSKIPSNLQFTISLTLCSVILFKNDCEIATVVSNW